MSGPPLFYFLCKQNKGSAQILKTVSILATCHQIGKRLYRIQSQLKRNTASNYRHVYYGHLSKSSFKQIHLWRQRQRSIEHSKIDARSFPCGASDTGTRALPKLPVSYSQHQIYLAAFPEKELQIADCFYAFKKTRGMRGLWAFNVVCEGQVKSILSGV